MRFTLTIDSSNSACLDMADLAIILDKLVGRVTRMRNDGDWLEGEEYKVLDANGQSVGTFTGTVAPWNGFLGPDEEDWEDYADDERDPFRDDVEADADVLASIGWGTDEEYGYYGEDDY